MGKVYNLCRVKTDISAVLTVMSGLNPHMINKLKDGFFVALLSTNLSVLNLAYCYSEEEDV